MLGIEGRDQRIIKNLYWKQKVEQLDPDRTTSTEMIKFEGRRGIGSKQMSWLTNIRDEIKMRNVEELFRLAENREQLIKVIW